MQTQTDASHVTTPATKTATAESQPAASKPALPENAGRDRPTPEGDGLDPTRYGDWEKNGRCIDF